MPASPAVAPAPRLPASLAVAGFTLAAALASAAAPLLVYTTTLAVFGAVHVGAELRYVDERFSARMGPRLVPLVAALLACTVLLRSLSVAGQIAAGTELAAELTLVALLALAVLPRASGTRSPRGILPLVVAGALVVGTATAPLETLVVLALLHNLTPVGLLAERLSGRTRRRALSACAIVFLAVPAVIATGLPARALEAAGLLDPGFLLFPAGSLDEHLRVFVPSPWLGSARARDLFAAATFLQCLHYGVVILVLPRLRAADGMRSPAPRLPWPSRRAFVALLVLASALSVAGFAAASFSDARAIYGILAAVHAWAEVPVLLFAFVAAKARHPAVAAVGLATAAAEAS